MGTFFELKIAPRLFFLVDLDIAFWCVGLGQVRGTHPAPFSVSFFNKVEEGDKIRSKNSWIEIKKGTSLTHYYHRQNRLNLGKSIFIYYQLKYNWMVRNKDKT